MSTVNVKFLSNHDHSLREFYQFAYSKKVFTDCVLYSQCDHTPGTFQNLEFREFHCHRLILCAYSDFFKQCFLNSSNATCILMDFSSRLLSSILQLIYYGHVEISLAEKERFEAAVFKLRLKEISCELNEDPTHLKRRLIQNHQQEINYQSPQKDCVESNFESNCETKNNVFVMPQPAAPVVVNCDPNVQSSLAATLTSSASSLPPPTMSTDSPVAAAAAPGGAMYRCPICNKEYTFRISLNKHMKCAHTTM